MSSCPPSKVRTYACDEDDKRVIKYFNYVYDFEEEKCVEEVRKKTVKCAQNYDNDDFEKSSHRRRRAPVYEEDEEGEFDMDDLETPK